MYHVSINKILMKCTKPVLESKKPVPGFYQCLFECLYEYSLGTNLLYAHYSNGFLNKFSVFLKSKSSVVTRRTDKICSNT